MDKNPKYKPVKIIFDLNDEHQLELYNHLKKRSNGSSYVRTLIYSDMNEVKPKINEQEVRRYEEPENNYVEEVIEQPPKVFKESQDDTVILDGIL